MALCEGKREMGEGIERGNMSKRGTRECVQSGERWMEKEGTRERKGEGKDTFE